MPATVTYSSISINGTEVSVGGKGTVSFTSPYNSIVVQFKSDVTLDTFQVRVIKSTSDIDIDTGIQAVYKTNIIANTTTSVTIPVNNKIFTSGDTTYTVGLFSRSSVDYEWDVTYLFMCLDASGNAVQFNPSDSTSGMEVLSSKTIGLE